MIMVDTSVWESFFNGNNDYAARELDRLLEIRANLVIIPIVLTEVLQGFRSDSGFARAKDLLTQLPILVPSIDTHVFAAELYQTLRRKGVTVRGTIDCLIAQVCIENNALLLSLDRDFQFIAQNTPLDLYPLQSRKEVDVL